MNSMRTPLRSSFALPLFALIGLFAGGCADSTDPGDGSAAAEGPEQAAYLTLMGDDTLAIEWIEFGDGYIQAESLIRGSSTTWGTYRLVTSPTGDVMEYEARSWEGGQEEGDLTRHEYLAQTDSGPQMVTVENSSSLRAGPFDATTGAVPFVERVHWPLEAAFRRQAAAGLIGDTVRTFSGIGVAVERNADGSWAVTHPGGASMTVVIGQNGEINGLDATGSTPAYRLERLPYSALDKTEMWDTFGNRPLGEPSPAR